MVDTLGSSGRGSLASTPPGVLVIGGGITGMTAALLLQREGKRVTALEANGGVLQRSRA